MDTEKCKTLLCVLEEGSLTAASERMGYTVSGISRMMAALEEEAGFPLLVRSRSGVTATEECILLLPTIRDLVRMSDQFQQLAGEVVGLARGTIRIGTSYYAFYDWFASLIAGFQKLFPGITVEIAEGTSTELLHSLEERSVDLCIISKRIGKCEWVPLKEDQLLACLPEKHPMAGMKHFPVEAFATEDFIELYPGRETDNSQMMERCGIKPHVRYGTSDNYAAYAMVAAGLGVACTNEIIGESFTEGVRYLPLSPPQYVEIGMALPPKEEMSPATARFAAYARQAFKKSGLFEQEQ